MYTFVFNLTLLKLIFPLLHFQHQWQVNKGKCGICGDPWESNPHPNEQGGKFSNGIIARTYHNDDTHINIAIEVEKNKNGYFEFRLCPEVSAKNPVTQECLNRFPLDIEGQGKRFYPQSSGTVYLRVAMPKGVLCERCVLQWKWHTGKLYICIYFQIKYFIILSEKFEDSKGVIRSHKSKDRQHCDQQKREKGTDNDMQSTTQKRLINTVPLKTGELTQVLR